LEIINNTVTECYSTIPKVLVIILVATVVGPVLVVEGIIIANQPYYPELLNQNAEKNIEIFESELSKARSLIQVTSNLQEMETISHQILENEIGISQSNEPEKRRILKNILDSSELYSEIGYFLPNGDLYLLEPFSQQSKFQFTNFVFRDWYSGALNTDGVYVSKVFESQPDYRKTIAFSKKITDENNQIVGILAGVVDFNKINEKISSKNAFEYYFVNHNQIVGSGDSVSQAFKHHTFTEEIELALSEKSGISEHTIDDISVDIVYKSVMMGDHTWAFLFVVNENIFDNSNQIRITLYGILTMFAGSMLFMIYKKGYCDYFGFKKTIPEISTFDNIEDTPTRKIS